VYALLVPFPDREEERWVGLRLTIHVPVGSESETLEQALEYVGDQRHNAPTVGRRFPTQSGIAGYACRNGEPHIGWREELGYEGYIRELVKKWHYTDKAARSIPRP
jgi:hypothetical protein